MGGCLHAGDGPGAPPPPKRGTHDGRGGGGGGAQRPSRLAAALFICTPATPAYTGGGAWRAPCRSSTGGPACGAPPGKHSVRSSGRRRRRARGAAPPGPRDTKKLESEGVGGEATAVATGPATTPSGRTQRPRHTPAHFARAPLQRGPAAATSLKRQQTDTAQQGWANRRIHASRAWGGAGVKRGLWTGRWGPLHALPDGVAIGPAASSLPPGTLAPGVHPKGELDSPTDTSSVPWLPCDRAHLRGYKPPYSAAPPPGTWTHAHRLRGKPVAKFDAPTRDGQLAAWLACRASTVATRGRRGGLVEGQSPAGGPRPGLG